MSGRADHLYDIDSAAAYLGIARATWLTHRRRGNAPQPAGRIGRSPYWTLEQLDAWKRDRWGKPGRPTRKGSE